MIRALTARYGISGREDVTHDAGETPFEPKEPEQVGFRW
jgi:hypothetical protein